MKAGKNNGKGAATATRTAVPPAPATRVSVPATAGSKAASPKAEVAATDRPGIDDVRRRAYDIYLRRNGAPGDPAADWAQAELELGLR